MNAKVLTVVVGLLLLIPAGYAANHSAKFGSCPNGYDCDQDPDGAPFPPDLVTGHTVYASFIMTVDDNDARRNTLGLPTDFAAVAGYFDIRDQDNITVARGVQRECVVWFNGKNLDQRPGATNFDSNAFPSDEDEPYTPGAPQGSGDQSYQDYDYDRDVESCMPELTLTGNGTGDGHGMIFAVVVEKGDCNPASGSNFEFRGHLDFVDPNNIYHEVQEYDYTCLLGGPAQGLLGLGIPSPIVSDAVKDLFPNSGTDPHNENGCSLYAYPGDGVDPDGPTNSTLGSDHFDFGHKCNGSIRDLFTERLWITPIHATVMDPSLNKPYNFAVQVDTCSGINIYEGIPVPGPAGPGKGHNGTDASRDPGSLLAREIDQVDYFLDDLGRGQPLVEVCHDGSSFSFDDTPRGRIVHSGPPTPGDEDMMRGNSYDFDPGSSTFGMHRNNCRSNYIDWPYNDYPGRNRGANFLGLTENGPRYTIGDDCYPEDHKTAEIDIYVYGFDPTGGLFAANSNGMTGPNAYVHAPVTGPNWLPGDPAPVQQ